MSTTGETEGEYMESTSESNQDDTHRKERMESNPLRSLGDALKEWKKRLNIVEKNVEKRETAKEERLAQETKAAAYEYLEDQDQPEDTQALGPTDKPQGDVPLMEDEEKEEEQEEDNNSKKDQKKENEKEDSKKEESSEQEPLLNRNKGLSKKEMEVKEEEMQDVKEVDEEAMDEEEIPKEKKENMLVAKQAPEIAGLWDYIISPNGILEIQKMDIEELMKLKEELEKPILEVDMAVAMELWKKFHYATSELSQELCEQLRLILEPTLATKLRGDYRTGKRINMKKVIPYIASDFKKDKIWLRRTQPSKRQYQIMLCIDDSKSMSDNQAGQMAFEAMTMIAKGENCHRMFIYSLALSQLEVGELGITSFGDSVKLLHKLNEPFSDEAGAKVIHIMCAISF